MRFSTVKSIICDGILIAALVSCNGGNLKGGSAAAGKKKEGAKDATPVTPAEPEIIAEDGEKLYLTKPKFALMARDLRCGLCHMRINGDIVSPDSVMSFQADKSIPAPGSDDHIVSPFRGMTMTGEYNEKITGTWFIKGTFPQDASKSKMKLKVDGGIKENYTGIEIPPKGFPILDLALAESLSKGVLEANGVKINGVETGNLVLDGSESPIKIEGEVMVKGDVVIFGSYTGRGTIYATGNIYIAGNIMPVKSGFPFPLDKKAAMEDGRKKALAQHDTDALALASKSSILLGNPSDRAVEMTPTKEKPVADKNIYSWFPGGQGAYTTLVNRKFGPTIQTTIEAFLYAEHLIGGKIGSYVINGGMLCDAFHILGTKGAFVPNTNSINYDYRFAGGLEILTALGPAFGP